MELTIEQKEKRSNYMKDYYKEHKEEMNAYSREYYKNNKEYYRDYYKNYYQENKKHMSETHRLWVEFNDKRDTIYKFVNSEGENIYIGSSTYMTRYLRHLVGNSHLKMSANEMVEEWGLNKILYKDFSEYNLSRTDLYYLESYYKLQEKEILKTSEVHFDEDKLTRSKRQLEELANSLEFIEFNKLKRYLN